MEEIFHLDEENDDPYFIEKLDLHSLPKLSGLLVQKDNTINGTDVDTNQSLIDNENKDVIGYMDMHDALIPLKLACRWLQNLKTLRIAFCDAVNVIFLFEENHVSSRAFNSLKELELHGLKNLVHIWFQIPPKIIAFQNLQVLVLLECHNLYLFSSRVAKLLVQLQKVFISRCDMMEEILVNADGKELKEKIVLPQLKLLELQRMSNLRVFYGGLSNIELPLLETVKFNQCHKMKSFSYGQLRTPMLERVQINGSLCSLMGDLNETMKRFVANRNGQVFVFSDLKIATNNFSTLLSGEGFSRNSYIGWIDEKTFLPSQAGTGVAVVIKKLKWESPQRLLEWRLDVDFLERKLHPNVVKLFGHCWNDKELLLVYEWMQRGSLDNHLFASDPLAETLSWDVRLKIAIGAARGFDFLHTSGPEVIHRNIKSSNILLDGNYNAKISGFVFRKLELLSDADSDMENRAMGTLGYVDPAYVKTGHLYVKSYIYSFGVVLLELMTGLRVLDENRPDGQQNLVDWLKPILLDSKRLTNIMDARMEGQCSSEAILLTAKLALKCTGNDPMNRPSMKEAVDELEQIQAIKGN
ncbi:Protein kinase superfamily protein [Euphorbia peplus]|nr:Protein kinase superfamily protein [Euphorbia peplus]